MPCKICACDYGCGWYKNMVLCHGCRPRFELEDKIKILKEKLSKKDETIKKLEAKLEEKDKMIRQLEEIF